MAKGHSFPFKPYAVKLRVQAVVTVVADSRTSKGAANVAEAIVESALRNHPDMRLYSCSAETLGVEREDDRKAFEERVRMLDEAIKHLEWRRQELRRGRGGDPPPSAVPSA